MHEFVASARNLGTYGIKALDVAKGLLERDFYAPTIYFPLVVPEAIMVEPTETESKAALDAFADAIKDIVQQAKEDPGKLHHEPHSLPLAAWTRSPPPGRSTPISRARARTPSCAGNLRASGFGRPSRGAPK